jgi:predicted neuraminidase
VIPLIVWMLLFQTQNSSVPVRDLDDHRVAARSDGRVRANSTQGYKEAYLPIIFPSSHAANLLQLKNGDLLCVWFSGVWEGDSGVGIVLSRKPKGSDVWTKPQLIDKKDGESYQNPVVFEDSEGKIHIFHTTQGAGAGEANSKVLEVTSNDHGFTWSTPKVLFEKGGSFTRHPLLVLQDGTWLLPMTYVTSKGIGEGAETNYSAMKLSHDRGRTWTECVVQDSLARVQPTVVDVGSNLVSFFRDRASDWIYRSTSSDGCHWSKPEPTVLPNNNASVQSFRLKNGHIVMVFDNSHANRSGSKPVQGLRKPLSIALSVDEGKSWSFVRDIEQGRPGYGAEEQRPKTPGREEYSYPTVMQTDDGKIHVAFTFRRQTIKEVELTEDWIRQGATVGVYKAK